MEKDLTQFPLPMDTKYRKKCVISLRKQAVLLINCNEQAKAMKKPLKTDEKGCCTDMYDILFHCHEKYINSLFTNPKTLDI